MNRFPKISRLVLYTKDVMLITGKGRTAARDLLLTILKAFNKKPGQFITIWEFSEYSGIDVQTVWEYINT